MSLEIKGQSCPICRAYLFDDDEIAVCPTCGAPHHRECFVNAKHCGMECFHGTDMQYDRVKSEEKKAEKAKEEQEKPLQNENVLIECPVCKKRYSVSIDTCPGCGAKNNFAAHAHRFDILGGVNPSEDLGEGHKAKDVATFIGGMTSHIIPKFKRIKLGKKISFGIWNFFFPAARFAARKMYKEAFIFGAVQVAAALLLLPFGNSDVIPTTNQGNIDYVALAAISQSIVKSPKFIMASVGTVLQFLGMIISGLFADVFYYKHVISTLTNINKESQTSEEKLLSYRKKGGFNLFGFLLTVMIINYSVSLIAILVGII